MITLIAGLLFLGFALLYALGIWAATWQEEELSLPHEKAVRMNIIVIALSFVLFTIALMAFMNIDWEHILILRT